MVEGPVRQQIVGSETTGDHRVSGLGDDPFQECEVALRIATRTSQVPGRQAGQSPGEELALGKQRLHLGCGRRRLPGQPGNLGGDHIRASQPGQGGAAQVDQRQQGDQRQRRRQDFRITPRG